MSHHKHQSQSYKLSARERENQKSRDEQLSEWSTLVATTIACFITDAPSIVISNWAKNNITVSRDSSKIGVEVEFGLKDVPAGDYNIAKQFIETLKPSELLKWCFGEGMGDLVAIPATIAIQRNVPEVMATVEKGLEAIAGANFRDASEKAAKAWAKKHDVSMFSEEYHDYKEQHYANAMTKTAQECVWTGISMAVGIAAQKWAAPKVAEAGKSNDFLSKNLPTSFFDEWSEDESIPTLIFSSAIGKAITLGAMTVPRMVAPRQSEKLDHKLTEWIEHHISTPTNNIMDALLGSKVAREESIDSHRD